MSVRDLDTRSRLYPEVRAGGFSRADGSIAFYLRVNALLEEFGRTPVTILDFGAGRGAFLSDEVPLRRRLRTLKSESRHVIGVDVDPAVLDNPGLDEAHVIEGGQRLPLADSSVDLVVSDYTFEHLQDPGWAVREFSRVLKTGGWICARTPNRWGYISVAARAVPNRLHVSVLRRVQPGRQEQDVFPTVYRLNTAAAIARWFPDDRFEVVAYAVDGEPAYVGRSVVAGHMMRLVSWLTPSRFRSMLLVFVRKRGE